MLDQFGRKIEYMRISLTNNCNLRCSYCMPICKEEMPEVTEFGGEIPRDMQLMQKLPGVGRKTANLILGDVYGQAGYVCDTHCIRITGLLGLTDGSKDPLKVEQQLRTCIPPEESSNFCHRMVLHGRAVCVARRPDCAGCTLRDLCDYGKTVREP